MKTEALTIADNLLAEILIMCAAQRDSKSIDHDLIFKINELLIQIDPIFREVRYNYQELEAPGFMRYRSELVRVFNGYLQNIDSLLPERQVTAAELPPGGPDGFKINHDYTVADVQQFLHDVFSYIDSVIDKEFPAQGGDTDPSTTKPVKLKFTVQNNQVYDVFKQLKKDGWISNTYEQIADFIFLNVEFKEGNNPNRDTIRVQIAKKENRPAKTKRFTLPGK